jgi:hypothetical protein
VAARATPVVLVVGLAGRGRRARTAIPQDDALALSALGWLAFKVIYGAFDPSMPYGG